MELNNLVKTTERTKKRIGRGGGSGKGGHTVGRGQKGQKARAKISPVFQGTKSRKNLFRRLPLLRGKGKFKSFKLSPIVVNLKYLNLFEKNETVNLESLVKKGIIAKNDAGLPVKILGEGSLSLPLIVQLPTSKGAKTKIEKAGGKVEMLVKQDRAVKAALKPVKRLKQDEKRQ